MNFKVVLTISSSVMNGRDEAGRPIPINVSATTYAELKAAVRSHFGAPDWKHVSASMTFYEGAGLPPKIINIDGEGSIPHIQSDSNGERKIIISAVNSEMKAGIDLEKREQYFNRLLWKFPQFAEVKDKIVIKDSPTFEDLMEVALDTTQRAMVSDPFQPKKEEERDLFDLL